MEKKNINYLNIISMTQISINKIFRKNEISFSMSRMMWKNCEHKSKRIFVGIVVEFISSLQLEMNLVNDSEIQKIT